MKAYKIGIDSPDYGFTENCNFILTAPDRQEALKMILAYQIENGYDADTKWVITGCHSLDATEEGIDLSEAKIIYSESP